MATGDIGRFPNLAEQKNIVTQLTAISAALQTLTAFDTTPTSNSGKPVTSGGIYNALQALKALCFVQSDSDSDRFTLLNKLLPHTAQAHNSVYRGKDLTSYWNSGEMSKEIQAGTFDDIFPGDYVTKTITYNSTSISKNYIVGELDYHLGMGDTETTEHHVLMFLESSLFTARMNSTDTTAGGYLASEMWTTTLPAVATSIKNAFGESHVLSHREILSDAQSTTVASMAGAGWTGGTTSWTWTDVIVNLFNEPMVYGTTSLSSSLFDVGECNSQVAAFRYNHGLIAGKRTWNWLRAVASSTHFCISIANGNANNDSASNASGGVRPYFLAH